MRFERATALAETGGAAGGAGAASAPRAFRYTACWEETKGSGDPSSLKPLHNLAKVQEKTGRVDEALQTHLRCLQLRRQYFRIYCNSWVQRLDSL
jgi:hypothetical protein